MNLRNFFIATLTLIGLILSCSSDPPANSPGGSSGMTSVAGGGAGGMGQAGTLGACAADQFLCSGQCRYLKSDRTNCGNCGRICGEAQACVEGVCQCPTNLLACGAACFDNKTDVTNCGTCGNQCSVGQNCVDGACACQAGLEKCDTTCVDKQSDPKNCGTCGNACADGQVCDLGQCVAACTGTRMACNGACVDTQSSVTNCGTCGNACGAGQTCSMGECSCSTPGQKSCGGTCVDTTSSLTNCGSCGNQCVGGQVCANSMCSCPVAGQQLCNNACTDTMTNAMHCGTCGKACGTNEMCVGGVCTCPSGQTCGGAGGAGSGGASGGGGTGGGSSGAPNRPPGCPGDELLISDFEEGTGTLVQQAGRDGFWYVFADMVAGAQQTPANKMDMPIDVAASGETEMCNKYALHSTATGHTQYVGFGGTFSPKMPLSTKMKNAYDVSQYSGISFKIKSGSGTAPPVYFEVLTKESQPVESGGTATNDAVDLYNTRGKVLTGIGNTWTTVHVPFGLLAPRYLPGDPACAAGIFCEAPKFVPTNALGFQFAVYDQFTNTGAYDLWVDEVRFYKGDEGIATIDQGTSMSKFPRDAAVGMCTKPAGASGKFLIDMYQKWKKTFVVPAGNGLRVQRPEENNDSVSEGIAYGMLIAVYMGDKALFDGLWTYWQSKAATGLLMHWKIDSSGNVTGSGSAADADQDAAFALLQAQKQWGGNYQTQAATMIGQIWNSDTDGSPRALNGGSAYPNVRNPSYFAPAFYREFAKIDGDRWNGIVDSSYTLINAIAGSNGLVPAWCNAGCTQRGGTGHTDGDKYQYDSHRTPWRVGLDYCWNGETRALAYVTKTTDFFAGKAVNGVGQIWDIYEGNGTQTSNAKKNSMSIIGTAAAGAMATAGTNAGHKKFLDSAYQFILDASYYTPAITQTANQTSYTYYNATVGLLTALTMSGNFVRL